MDIESLRKQSWCLCRMLDTIIGTKEEVEFRRKCDTMFYYVHDVLKKYKPFHSGSRGEGFNLQSSDIDMMYIDTSTKVLESSQNSQTDDDFRTVLVMKREECNPGFVILQMVQNAYNQDITQSIVEYNSHPVVSSMFYRDQHRLPEFDEVGHGPCNQSNIVQELDRAHCFECKGWPAESLEFIFRARKYGWPSKTLLEKIVQKGCHVVPIGEKDHDLSYIQWRLSFSAAEKRLVHSFNHTQFLVYGLLKLFLKEVINKLQHLSGILCSYFLKTVLFYTIENTPSTLWRDDLSMYCFWLCLNKLTKWVENGYCPSYFVFQNNLFRNKVHGEQQRNILTFLNQCKRMGWNCIYLCRSLQPLQNLVNPSKLFCPNNLIKNQTEREWLLDLVFFRLCNTFNAENIKITKDFLLRSLRLINFSRTQQEEDISILLFLNAFTSYGQMFFSTNIDVNNKNRYKTTRYCYRLFLTSAKNQICSGFISLATFYYVTGQYKKAIFVCDHAISLWKPFMLYVSEASRKIFYNKLYQRIFGLRITNKVKFAVAFDMSIYHTKKAFYPAELLHDAGVAYPYQLHLPPLPYTEFLLFLCHHKLGDIEKSMHALHVLRALVNDEQQGYKQYPIVLNLLAICLEKVGNTSGVIELCLLSQKLKPQKNGAERLLDKVLTSWY